MKKLVALIYLFTCACISRAQVNYVLNPSLEAYRSCPAQFDQIQLAKYWSAIDTVNLMVTSGGDTFSQSNCAPEYINTCANGTYAGAPDNSYFFQYPRSGRGMSMVTMYEDGSFPYPLKRDYLVGRLRIALTPGKTYCVTFYVNFCGFDNTNASGYAVDHFGAYLDNGSICQDTGANNCGLPHPEYLPQVYTTTIIVDSMGWTKVQGSLVANGMERFITIGNFFDNSSINYIASTSSSATSFSWYLVDDVSIIENTELAHAGTDAAIVNGDSVHIGTNEEGMPCTWYVLGSTTPIGYSGGIWVKPTITTSYVVEMDLCGSVTRDTVKVTVWPVGVEHPALKAEPSIWPNPVLGDLHIDGAALSEVVILDVVGRVVYKNRLSSEHEVISSASLMKGVYLVLVNDKNGERYVKRIVKD